ncbi:lytic transglycosylase domain-containing protein [Sediminitomix flava]|uniref:Membrane-bound lytic murein transglycosylase D n=1 Tax=Sediminitomix flava TaxID=379075 RepID=A0A315Z5T3_SEDFL|nr:lytic transglycosylase domain-containing protein [Sediminitomix flava]PWJ39263.1 membrane-bound lytic murein transglycosylase D [Sediminitomix flava]
MSSIKKAFLVILLLVVGGEAAVYAQDYSWEDSVYTVQAPEGYVFPMSEDEVVEAATSAPGWDEYADLGFDPDKAIILDDFIRNDGYIPRVSNEVLEERLKAVEGDIPLTFNNNVRMFIDYFSVKKRGYTLEIMQRTNMYFPTFERILNEVGVPEELKYLSIIESALKPVALSRVGAKGLWQFMPATGRSYGLKMNYYVDERMDPEKSTRAAAKYLKYLHDYFGDWELAIAAYNCGPGNIRKAQRRTGKFHFWDIYHKLPRETRGYLPQFVAMLYVLNYTEEHNLFQDNPNYEIPAAEIFVSQSVDLSKLASEIKVCKEDLYLLNPELRLKFVPKSAKNYALNIPAARVENFEENRASILKNVKYTGSRELDGEGMFYHRVRSGDNLGKIARMYGVKIWQIKDWNGLSGSMIRIGQKLRIYGRGYTPSKAKTASSSSSTSSKPKPVSVSTNGTHTVKSGESLYVIAKAYGMTIEQLKSANGLTSSKIRPGQKLKVSKGSTTAKSSNTSNSTSKASASSANMHTVKSGDSLWSIAKKYATTVSQLKKLNNLKSDKLSLGQKLKVK